MNTEIPFPLMTEEDMAAEMDYHAGDHYAHVCVAFDHFRIHFVGPHNDCDIPF